LAAGKALLTGDFGEIGEVVAAHRLGMILTSYEPTVIRQALLEFRDDRASLREMKDRAKQLARTVYNSAKAHAVLTDVYRNLLDKRASDAAITTGRDF
jgi:hypothetical protein